MRREGTWRPFALIPGAGGDPWEWHRLVPELEARGDDAIAVRLPADDDTACWSEYADAVIDAVGDRSDLIVVAGSTARRKPRHTVPPFARLAGSPYEPDAARPVPP